MTRSRPAVRGARPRALPAIALSVVAGLGHVYLGRHAQGLVLFALFAAAANGVLVGSVWIGEEAATIRSASMAVAAAVWVASLAGVLRLTAFTDRDRLRARRDERLREGIARGLVGDWAGAGRAFEEARACDVDRRDAEVLFWLGASAGRRGERRGAERWFRRCAGIDALGAWRAEMERERAAWSGTDRSWNATG